MATSNNNHEEELSFSRLNWLRAAVLGANDGVVSVSAIILGVVGATNNRGAIFTAGLAGLVAGALSMAVGEYVSVSSQRDSERAFIAKEKKSLRRHPDEEFEELAEIYEAKGLTKKTSKQVAKELTAHDAVKAHLDAELNLDEDYLNNPWQAAVASLLSFTVGGVVPLIAVLLAAAHWRFTVTFIAVLITLVITGYLSAVAGNAPRGRAVFRVAIGGAVAMVITYFVGTIFGTAIS
jgi:VIT1/CCC1 family predicted Fe2+/Mn2+ transporter